MSSSAHRERVQFLSPLVTLALWWLLVLLMGCTTLQPRLAETRPATQPGPKARAVTVPRILLPVLFEKNVGQTDARVRFVARSAAGALFMTDEGVVFALASPVGWPEAGQKMPAATKPVQAASATVRMTLVGAAPGVTPVGEAKTPTVVRYAGGATSQKPKGPVPTYGRVRYSRVYPGVDLVFEERGARLRYHFQVAAGADSGPIRLRFAGALTVQPDTKGRLVLETHAGRVVHSAPHIYQIVQGRRVPLRGAFAIRGPNEVGFDVAGRDPSAPLIIDPEIVFATYLGGSGGEEALLVSDHIGVTTDGAGYAFVVGPTRSSDFPLTAPLTPQGLFAGFVARYDLTNLLQPRLEWVTLLDGNGYDDATEARAAIDGGVYVVGTTDSSDFAAPENGSGPSHRGYVAKLDASGDIVALRSVGDGRRHALMLRGVALEETSTPTVSPGVYIAGDAWTPGTGSYATPGAYQPDRSGYYDGFVAKLDLGLTTIIYLSYLGGSSEDRVKDIAVWNGRAHVVGCTSSQNFPTTQGAFQSHNTAPSAGSCVPGQSPDTFCWDGFVTVFDPSGGQLVYSTRLGHDDGDCVYDISVDSAGQAIVVGNSGLWRALVARFGPLGQGRVIDMGSLDNHVLEAVALDGLGRAKIVGSKVIWQGGNSYTTGDAFFAILGSNDTIEHFAYFGRGVPTDVAVGGAATYVAGHSSGGLQTVNATQPTPGGLSDAFLVRIDEAEPALRLALRKYGEPDSVAEGVEFAYEVSVANEGLTQVQGISLVDQLPACVEIVGVSPATCQVDLATNAVTCTTDNLAPGEHFSAILRVRATCTGAICNMATLTTQQTSEPVTAEACTTVTPPLGQGAGPDIAFVDDLLNGSLLKVFSLADGQLRFPEHSVAPGTVGLEYARDGGVLAVIEPGRVRLLNAETGSEMGIYLGSYKSVAFRPREARDIAFVKKLSGGDYKVEVSFGSTGADGEASFSSSLASGETMSEPKIAWSPDGTILSAAFTVTEPSGVSRLHWVEWTVPAVQSGGPGTSWHWPLGTWPWPHDPEAERFFRVLDVANVMITEDRTRFNRLVATNSGVFLIEGMAARPLVFGRIYSLDIDAERFVFALVDRAGDISPARREGTLLFATEAGIIDGPWVGWTPVAVRVMPMQAVLVRAAVTTGYAVVVYRMTSQGVVIQDLSLPTTARRARHLVIRPAAP